MLENEKRKKGKEDTGFSGPIVLQIGTPQGLFQNGELTASFQSSLNYPKRSDKQCYVSKSNDVFLQSKHRKIHVK